jgi:ABC-2 type transport system permease protein
MMAAFGAADLNFGTLGGFLGVEYLSLIWVAIVAAAVIGFAAKSIASEVDDGTMDLTLTQPVSRLQVAVSRWTAMVIYATAISLATTVPIWTAGLVYDIDLDAKAMPLLFALGLVLMVAMGSFAFMVSAFSTGGGRVAAVSAGVLGAMWLANFASALNESTQFLDGFTVFHYWKPGAIIDEAVVSAGSWWAFGLPAVAFTAVAIWRFVNRDIAA